MRHTPSKFCANLLYLKNALYLSGTKVLIEDTIVMSPAGDGTTFLSSCLHARQRYSFFFLVILRP